MKTVVTELIEVEGLCPCTVYCTVYWPHFTDAPTKKGIMMDISSCKDVEYLGCEDKFAHLKAAAGILPGEQMKGLKRGVKATARLLFQVCQTSRLNPFF